MSTTDKTRTEDPREVLTTAIDGLEREGRWISARALKELRDRDYPPPAPPKPEPVWRKESERTEYEIAVVDGRLMWRNRGKPADTWECSISVTTACQLAADYWRQQGVAVPDEALRACAAGAKETMRRFLEDAAPHILAANGKGKPKAVDWVVWDVRDRRVVYCPRDHADALSWVRAFGNDATSILALVEPSEVQP